MSDDAAALRRLLDREAIRDCLVRYARGVDRHDAALIASAFHPDAFGAGRDYTGTREEFAAWANELHAGRWSAHQHFLAQSAIELDGDRADVETYVSVVGTRHAGDVIDVIAARYLDRCERRDGEWRIAERRVAFDSTGSFAAAPAD